MIVQFSEEVLLKAFHIALPRSSNADDWTKVVATVGFNLQQLVHQLSIGFIDKNQLAVLALNFGDTVAQLDWDVQVLAELIQLGFLVEHLGFVIVDYLNFFEGLPRV